MAVCARKNFRFSSLPNVRNRTIHDMGSCLTKVMFLFLACIAWIGSWLRVLLYDEGLDFSFSVFVRTTGYCSDTCYAGSIASHPLQYLLDTPFPVCTTRSGSYDLNVLRTTLNDRNRSMRLKSLAYGGRSLNALMPCHKWSCSHTCCTPQGLAILKTCHWLR